MEPNSQTDGVVISRRILESQIRECYGRVVYTHKTHEKCGDILLSRLSRIKLVQIVLSVVTTGALVSTFLGGGTVAASVGVVLSTALMILNAYTKNYDLGELAQRHKQTANEIWLIREQYLSLLVDIATGLKPIEGIQEERDKLLVSMHSAYTNAPSTTSQAYKMAQVALQFKEDMTFTEGEIDAFLPEELRRGNNQR